MSQQHVSDLERGKLTEMALGEVGRLFEVLDARVIVGVSWRGGQLDRLLDEDHAALCRSIVAMLQRHGWTVLPEVTYSIFGERGSIDVLAWHAPTRTLLVVEVKTEIASVEEMLRRHDAKVRLAPRIGRERFGEAPASVAKLLVLGGTMTNRRRVTRLSTLLERAYPSRGADVRRWLCAPAGPIHGLLFTRTAAVGEGPDARNVARPRGRPATAPGG